MGLLTKDDILGADDLATEDVEVPEWGGCVRVRALTGTERDAFEAAMFRMPKPGKKGVVMPERDMTDRAPSSSPAP